MSKFLEISWKFPWIRYRSDVLTIADVPSEMSLHEWVILPDGRTGLIHHIKTDGRLGVRPVNSQNGQYYPNPSPHWNWNQRMSIPEEIALPKSAVKKATRKQIPRFINVH